MSEAASFYGEVLASAAAALLLGIALSMLVGTLRRMRRRRAREARLDRAFRRARQARINGTSLQGSPYNLNISVS